jgi:hypothetical protein
MVRLYIIYLLSIIKNIIYNTINHLEYNRLNIVI